MNDDELLRFHLRALFDYLIQWCDDDFVPAVYDKNDDDANDDESKAR